MREGEKEEKLKIHMYIFLGYLKPKYIPWVNALIKKNIIKHYQKRYKICFSHLGIHKQSTM